MITDVIEIIVRIDAHHLIGTAVVGSHVAGSDTGAETGCQVALLEECAAICCLVRNHATVIGAVLKTVVLIVEPVFVWMSFFPKSHLIISLMMRG